MIIRSISVRGVLSFIVLVLSTEPCTADPIEVFSTGVGRDGQVLTDRSVDPHYRIVTSPEDGPVDPDALVAPETGFPLPSPWLENDSNSRWITPTANLSNSSPGLFVYETEFDLTGLDPATARITGGWATDDEGVEIQLNGLTTSFSTSPTGYRELHPFTLSAGFIQGRNVLRFLLENHFASPHNPSGLRVHISSASANRLPGPGESVLVHFNDFEDPTNTRGYSVENTWLAPGTDQHPADRFLGEFGNQGVDLQLTELPDHDWLVIEFDLYILRSWDGLANPTDPDFWGLQVDGTWRLRTSFSNMGTQQAYPDELAAGTWDPRTGADETNTLGFRYAGRESVDSVYRFKLHHRHSAGAVEIRFSASGLSELADESWGLDNVRISTILDEPPFLRGDASGDGTLDLTDAVEILLYMFRSGSLNCLDGADFDDSGHLNITDPIGLIAYLFQGKQPPPSPFPECGLDPTEDGLACEAPGACAP